MQANAMLIDPSSQGHLYKPAPVKSGQLVC